MKKPRVKDFDPNATPELSSPMDDMPSIQRPTERVAKATVVPADARNLGRSIGMVANRLQEELSHDTKEQSKIGKEVKRETGKPVNWETSKEVNRLTGKEGNVLQLFDLNVSPYRKDSFLFTDDEFYEIVEFKQLLRRMLDIRVVKDDLMRTAIDMLIADYKQNGESSVIVKRLRSKKTTKK